MVECGEYGKGNGDPIKTEAWTCRSQNWMVNGMSAIPCPKSAQRKLAIASTSTVRQNQEGMIGGGFCGRADNTACTMKQQEEHIDNFLVAPLIPETLSAFNCKSYRTLIPPI